MAKKNIKKKIVFIDRDGVINQFPGNGLYVTKVKNFHFLPRALEGLKILTDAGCENFVISNQAGVGKGVFSQDKLNRITRKMITQAEKYGGKINKVFYCTHRADAGCICRKPGIGNLTKAFQSINRSMRSAKNAYFIGDTKADIETGFNAGCTTIFVLSGRENRKYMRTWTVKPDYIAKDLFEATKIVIGNGRASDFHFRKVGPKIHVKNALTP